MPETPVPSSKSANSATASASPTSASPSGVSGREIALWSLLFAVAAVLAVAVFLRRQADAALPVYGEIPDFSFVNRDGRTVGRADLLGRPWVADFIFTRCPGICPRMTQQMGRVAAVLPAARLVSFSVDPEHDTPEVLDEYARQHGASDGWWFLTGDRDAIHALSRDGFLLAIDATPAGAAPTGDASSSEWITHSSRFVLVDGAARIRGYYDSFDDADVDRLVDELGALLEADPGSA